METKAGSVIQAIIIISSIFTLVGVFVISYILYFNKKKLSFIEERNVLQKEFSKQLRQSQIEVQEQTSQHIGKELHDNVGQLLSTSRMLLGLTERSLAAPPDTLLTANATLAQAISELRSLSKSLDKEWLEQFSFADNLRTEITRINSGGTILAQYIEQDRIELKADEQIILFRIVQEAMQNAIKHASPTNITVGIKKDDVNYQIMITDNGTGFNPALVTEGMGLFNMKHRVALLQGNIAWMQTPGSGTQVSISLPVKNIII